jgi:hypothetical protein
MYNFLDVNFSDDDIINLNQPSPDNLLRLEFMKDLSIDQIINLYRRGYRIEADKTSLLNSLSITGTYLTITRISTDTIDVTTTNCGCIPTTNQGYIELYNIDLGYPVYLSDFYVPYAPYTSTFSGLGTHSYRVSLFDWQGGALDHVDFNFTGLPIETTTTTTAAPTTTTTTSTTTAAPTTTTTTSTTTAAPTTTTTTSTTTAAPTTTTTTTSTTTAAPTTTTTTTSTTTAAPTAIQAGFGGASMIILAGLAIGILYMATKKK